MPEGDTVYRTARRLASALVGHQLTGSDFRVPSYATLDLSGSPVRSVRSRGKHLLMEIGEVVVRTHLRMDGRWVLHPREIGRAPVRQRLPPAHLLRVRLTTKDWSADGYELGEVEVLPAGSPIPAIERLGPDLLSADFDRLRGEALARVAAALGSGRALGEVLHDQTVLAGLGNVYVNEMCFLLGRHPDAAAADADPARVLDLARRLLLANRDRGERVTTGRAVRGQRLYVYGRRGQPCRRCGTPLRGAEFGPHGRERITCWCPHCQPLPR